MTISIEHARTVPVAELRAVLADQPTPRFGGGQWNVENHFRR